MTEVISIDLRKRSLGILGTFGVGVYTAQFSGLIVYYQISVKHATGYDIQKSRSASDVLGVTGRSSTHHTACTAVDRTCHERYTRRKRRMNVLFEVFNNPADVELGIVRPIAVGWVHWTLLRTPRTDTE